MVRCSERDKYKACREKSGVAAAAQDETDKLSYALPARSVRRQRAFRYSYCVCFISNNYISCDAGISGLYDLNNVARERVRDFICLL